MTSMKTYEGRRHSVTKELTVYVTDLHTNKTTSLPPRNDLQNHSPDGFECGYAGSGPAQLALAILCDHLHDDQNALKYYMDFKLYVIANLSRERNWCLTSWQVEDAVQFIKNSPPHSKKLETSFP